MLALLASGCTAGTPEEPATSRPPSATAAATPTPTTEALEFPPVADDEIARAEFRTVGAQGVPESASITSNALETDGLAIEGECRGTSMAYRVNTAAVGEDQRMLTEGVMKCDTGVLNQHSGLGYTGLVQVSFTDTSDITEGWVTLVPFEG